MISDQQITDQTINWIHKVVIGCNFCPFAANVINHQKVHYQVEHSTGLKQCLDSFLKELDRLNADQTIETSFLIFPHSFHHFDDYLDLVFQAEGSLKKNGYDGIYQLASFHPLYRFADSTNNDAANYTNRSVYPMLHMLREESIDKALAQYKNPEHIPEHNVNFARDKGLIYMKMLRDSCF